MFSQLLRAIYLEVDFQSWRNRHGFTNNAAPRFSFCSLRIRGLI